MNIHINSIPVKAVLNDIATSIGNGKKGGLRENKIADNCSEFFLDIPKAIGEGCISGITFPTGFSLYQYNCSFNRDIKFNFNINKIQPLKFIFCNEGKIYHSFADENDKMNISLYQNIIVAGEKENGHNLYFEAGKRVGLTTLEIDRPKFKKFHAYTDDSLTAQLLRVLNDTASNREFYYQGNYSLNTADLIQGLRTAKYQGFLRFLFLQGASNILLAHQIEQFIDDEQSKGFPQLLRQRDLENVKTAIEIIRADMQTSFSVNDLATQTGTNSNKLQEGFKHLYDTTVNRYIHELRMDVATSLLEHSDLNISEIVSSIGLNSRSYFSKVFKEAYGVSPRYFRTTKEKEQD